MRRSHLQALPEDEESPNCGVRRRFDSPGKPQGTVLDNIEAEQSDGKCNREETA